MECLSSLPCAPLGDLWLEARLEFLIEINISVHESEDSQEQWLVLFVRHSHLGRVRYRLAISVRLAGPSLIEKLKAYGHLKDEDPLCVALSMA